jgi:hypothetical protein
MAAWKSRKTWFCPFFHIHGGDDLTRGLSADVSRLRVELQALGGVLNALFCILQPAGPTSLEVQETTASPRTMPEEHLVSYA